MKRLAAAVLALALIASACSSSSSEDDDDRLFVDEDGGTIAVDGGVDLRVPAGAFDDKVEVHVRDGHSLAGLPEGVSVRAAVDVEIDQAPAEPVTAVFEVGPTVGTVVAFHEGEDGVDYLHAEVDRQSGTASVELESLSLFGLLDLDADVLGDQLRDVFSAYTGGGADEAPDPSCPDEDAAREGGWSIASTNSDTVRWCFGRRSGQRILTMVDNRRYPLTVQVPRGATFVERSDRGFAARVSEAFLRDDWLVLDPRASATWAVDPGTGRALRFRTEFDGLAQAMTAIDVAVSWLAEFAARVPGTRSASKGRLLELIEQSPCIRSLFDQTDPQNPLDGGDVLRLVQGCVLDRERIVQWAGGGVSALLLGLVATVFSTGEFFISSWQALVAQWTDEDDYRIAIAREAAAPAGAPLPLIEECRSRGTPAIGDDDAIAFTAGCFYASWVAGDRTLAADFADPAAIDAVFEFPWHDGWTFEGCSTDHTRPTWLGNVCSAEEDAPPGALHGVLLELYFTAYDDVAVVGEAAYFG